jgi:hypothetical protein
MSEVTSSEASATCPNHPGVAAQFVCGRCQTPVCVDCCYSLPDATVCCKTCYDAQPAEPKVEAAAPPDASSAPSLRLAAYQPTAEPAARNVPPPRGQGCAQHPHVRGLARCHNCGAYSCLTCDFLFPGNLHFCPVCVSTGSSALSPRRKKYMIASFILAAWATFGFALFFGGAAAGLADTPGGEVFMGLLMLGLAGVPSVVGTALGMSARRPGAANPVSVWIALIWNSLLLGGMILLIGVGIFMGD